MLLATALIATSHPVVALVAGRLDSAALTAVRFLLATACFLPVVAIGYGRAALPTPGSVLRHAVLSAPLVAFFVAMFEALRTASAVNTAALSVLVPSFAALFSIPLLREQPSARRAGLLLLGTIGSGWVVFRGDLDQALSLELHRGEALFLAGTASLGLYAVLVRRLGRGRPPAVTTFWTLACGSVWLLLWLVLAEGGALSSSAWRNLELRDFLALAYLAAGATMATFYLTQRATQILGPTRAMAYNFLTPALVAGFAAATGSEALAWIVAPGVLLTLLALSGLLRMQDRAT
jgi:drug/metabolite transporter (DMT)-like permease